MADGLLTRAIDTVASRRDLSADEAAEALAVIMTGDAGDEQVAGLLIGLRTKGETPDELAGLARTMRALAEPVHAGRDDLVDTAGTGGGRSTFNVSTTAALVAAGAGCAVAKHGNRSATGASGSADVLEALGVRIDLPPAAVARCIEEIGFGFMFAPAHHRAMRHVVGVRRALQVRTVFNLLGPLTNPAGARRQVIGVSDPPSLEVVAGALARLGADRALVVCSTDGFDEMSIAAATRVAADVLISSSPSSLDTTSARSHPSRASACAMTSSMAGSETPMSWRRAPAGFVSGPRMLKTVRTASSRRTGMTQRMAAWWAGANMKPKPVASTQRATASGW
ncbi:MAG: anthranilate phosphoribosyltransferase, partial [Solirubrobacterales bacterium]|nr:anthranilate phosphoribosyltransferase [Solirubrobacterales bacterium]